jgi:hypothetical protein
VGAARGGIPRNVGPLYKSFEETILKCILKFYFFLKLEQIFK